MPLNADSQVRLKGEIADGMERKLPNSGVFAQFPERMSKKRIREIASEYDISLKGITLVIDKDPEKANPKFNYFGRADTQNIGRVDFMLSAFSSKEELPRTLFHEKIHVEQLRKYGVEYIQRNRSYF